MKLSPKEQAKENKKVKGANQSKEGNHNYGNPSSKYIPSSKGTRYKYLW